MLNITVGVTPRVDVQFVLSPYARSTLEDVSTERSKHSSGIGKVLTRVKVNVWGNDYCRTAFAAMPYVKWPLASSEVRNGKTEGVCFFRWACTSRTKTSSLMEE